MEQAVAALGVELMQRGIRRTALFACAAASLLGMMSLWGCSKNTNLDSEEKAKLEASGEVRQAEGTPTGGATIPGATAPAQPNAPAGE